jgi:hypothetical protein
MNFNNIKIEIIPSIDTKFILLQEIVYIALPSCHHVGHYTAFCSLH